MLRTTKTSLSSPCLCGRGVEYAHRIPACRMRRLKGCPDSSATTAWDYAGPLCSLYRDAAQKRCQHSQTFTAHSTPLTHAATCC